MKMTKIAKKHRRGFSNSHRNILRIALLFFLIVILTPNVNAFEFDDVKNYDYEKKEYTITNAFGLGKEIAKIKLNTPQMFEVALGYQKVAEFTITNGDSYENIFKQMQFYNINEEMKEFSRDFDYKYKIKKNVEIQDYKKVCEIIGKVGNLSEVCSWIEDGTHIERVDDWEDFTGNSLSKDEEITI